MALSPLSSLSVIRSVFPKVDEMSVAFREDLDIHLNILYHELFREGLSRYFMETFDCLFNIDTYPLTPKDKQALEDRLALISTKHPNLITTLKTLKFEHDLI